MMSESTSPEQIQTQIDQARANLSASVDELANRVDPRSQVRAATADLRTQAEELGEVLRESAQQVGSQLEETAAKLRAQGEDTIERAKQGDSQAITTVAAVAAGVVGAAGLLAVTIFRR